MVESGHNGPVIQDSSLLQCKEDCRSYESYLGKHNKNIHGKHFKKQPPTPRLIIFLFFSDEI